jgi:hypothetical protein
MKRLFALARLAAALCCVLLTAMGSSLLAQSTGSVDPRAAPVEPSVKQDDPPPGGCMPIGLTVSGEVVFPFQCKEFIERLKARDQKAAVGEEKPAAAQEEPGALQQKPAAEEKPAATEEKPPAVKEETTAAKRQNTTVAPESIKAVDVPVEKAPFQKRAARQPRERSIGQPACTHFRTYEPESGTYRSYDGYRRSCP